MKAQFLFISIIFYSLLGYSYSENLKIDASDIQIEGLRAEGETFSKIAVKNLGLSNEVGAPALPVKTLLLIGQPQEVQVQIEQHNSVVLDNTLPYPAQAERVRHPNAPLPNFSYNPAAYENQRSSSVQYQYLGTYRGLPVTQVNIAMGRYDADSNSVILNTEISIESSAEVFNPRLQPEKKYLIVVPKDMVESIHEFVTHKESQGYTVFVEELETPELTTDGVKTLVSDYYHTEKIGYVLFVSSKIPLLKASTSQGRADTDLYYLTMDGSDDYIPDVLGGRIPGRSLADIQQRLAKSIDFENKTFPTSTGKMRIIGIASNEGSNPSDNEYIQSIEESFVQKQGYENIHFYQSSSNSTPAHLNAELEVGANWLFYMGHGSGTSWPSMRKTYNVSDIHTINNPTVTKPIIIDVACQNGALADGYLGTSFSSILSLQAEGAAAYYGGTVNISWHPPAIMARGIAFEHNKNNYATLGEAILAGQLYLAANYNSKSDIVDNMEWYVLQGDPSLMINF